MKKKIMLLFFLFFSEVFSDDKKPTQVEELIIPNKRLTATDFIASSNVAKGGCAGGSIAVASLLLKDHSSYSTLQKASGVLGCVLIGAFFGKIYSIFSEKKN